MSGLVFDYDGTLHDTIRIYAPAFKKAYQYLTEKRLAPKRDWTDREISRWLGYSSRDMWNSFMPNLSEKEKEICSNMIGQELLQSIRTGRCSIICWRTRYTASAAHGRLPAHIPQ